MSTPRDFGFDQDALTLKEAAHDYLQDQLRAGLLLELVKTVERDPRATLPDGRLQQDIMSLGWNGLAIASDEGGVGASFPAIVGVAEELGRSAAPIPLLSTLIACQLLQQCHTDAAREVRKAVAGGATVTLAFADQRSSQHCRDTRVRFEDGRLKGIAWFVQDGCQADWYLVAAKDASGIGWYAVPADDQDIDIIADDIADLTRTQARIECNAVAGGRSRCLVAQGEGIDCFEKALPGILAISAADMAGAAEWLLQTTTDYARTRTQFGVSIGSFQAVKHPLVDLMIMIDQARSLAYATAGAISAGADDAMRLARMAKEAASEAAGFSVRTAIQLHGGIAYTWECAVHIFAKRQKHSQMLFGGGAAQREALARMLLDGN